ncbi:S-layer homology domain-containing protein [Paenibacillus sp. XY044]|uniref:S-layer homology domain-containing protein n=1 Tax=Paenibacillus sp. XY044 TaxID=2026089 RepID=UPI000B98367B|nr:S-layer homology domain-containing protein [Paenibacillus sp. XY044]OZB92788.1 hypothetical protein CJP46_23070 [Paenibacillus sp. XY044]
MHRLRKLSLGAVLALGLQQLYPMAAYADIAVEPQQDPFVFYVSDSDYGDGYRLRVSSYDDQGELLNQETSENPPDEPFVISINPYDNPWVPHVDLDDPHPITFRVETIKTGDSGLVDVPGGSEGDGTSEEGSESSGGASGLDSGSSSGDGANRETGGSGGAGSGEESGTGAGGDGSVSGGEIGDGTAGGTTGGSESTAGSDPSETGGTDGSGISDGGGTGDAWLGDPIPGSSGEPGTEPGIGIESVSTVVQQGDRAGVTAVPGSENGEEIVDSADYTWSPVATVEGSLLISREQLDDLNLRVTDAEGHEVMVPESQLALSYDDASHTVRYEANLPKGGPYNVTAEVNGQPYGSVQVNPITMENRFPSKTLLEGSEIHTYFEVKAEQLVPYTVEKLDGMDAILNAADGQLVDFGELTDDASKEVDLPFEFPFYGDTYSQMWIDINGGLYFGDYNAIGSDVYPDKYAPPALQAYVSDLRLNPDDPDSKILTETIGEEGNRKFIVQWNHVYFYDGDVPITFQAILSENGDVQYQYPGITTENADYDNGASSTIGIQAGQGLSQNYLLYSHRESMIDSGEAIRFSPVTVSDENPSDGDHGSGGDGGSGGGGDNGSGDNGGSDNSGDNGSGGNGGSNNGGGNTGGSGGSNNGGSTGGSTSTTPTSPGNSTAGVPAPVVVNGKSYDGVLQTTTATNNGQTSVTAVLDASKLQAMLSQAGPGQSVTLPVMQAANTTTVGLTAQSLRALETGASQLVIQTANGNYNLPISEISMSRLARLFQASGDVTGMNVQIIVARSEAARAAQLEAAAKKMELQFVAGPVDFRIVASFQGQTLSVSPYSTYVQHVLQIPAAGAGVVSTGVMLDENGTVHPVPTRLTGENGSRSAIMSSLGGGTFALVSYSTSFSDVSGHTQEVVQDLASRLILQGTGEDRFAPDHTVSCAEFAAILVRALGLAGGGQSSSYADVKPGDWYTEAVTLAQQYGIVNGYSDGTFRPGHTITREEALVMFGRAGKLARLGSGADQVELSQALSVFTDSQVVSGWAAMAVAEAVHNQLLDGLGSQLQPKKEITRAETAEILQRLLKKSDLI